MFEDLLRKAEKEEKDKSLENEFVLLFRAAKVMSSAKVDPNSNEIPVCAHFAL